MNELVSIIMPIHNAEEYLNNIIDKIISQTYKNIEIILLNDSSNDNTSKICIEVKKTDNRIKYYEVFYKSAGKTRNYGLKVANGNYIIFIDADDFITENMVEKLYFSVKKNDADACFTSYTDKNLEYSRLIGKYLEKQELFENEIKNNLIFNTVFVEDDEKFLPLFAVWNGIYKKEIITKNNFFFFDENEVFSEDSIFNFYFLSNSKKINLINENLYTHIRDNKDSICNKYNDRYNKIPNWYNKIYEYGIIKGIDKNNLYQILNRRYLELVINRINQEVYLSNKNKKDIFQNIESILNDSILRKILSQIDYNKTNFKRKVLIMALKNKYKILIYILFKLRK